MNSENVKLWRINCKQRMIDSMGGRCCICKYNKCNNSLAFHHLDPSKKDLSLSGVRANPKSWIKIVEELRKCILVCHNCHSEIHAGITLVPEDAPKFNEEYVTYKEKLSNCIVCNKLKSNRNKTCSYVCAGKLSRKINWDKIDLLDIIKTKSVLKLAKELGCSDAAIYKRLKKITIPI